MWLHFLGFINAKATGNIFRVKKSNISLWGVFLDTLYCMYCNICDLWYGFVFLVFSMNKHGLDSDIKSFLNLNEFYPIISTLDGEDTARMIMSQMKANNEKKIVTKNTDKFWILLVSPAIKKIINPINDQWAKE